MPDLKCYVTGKLTVRCGGCSEESEHNGERGK
jgi:hypothetical protein